MLTLVTGAARSGKSRIAEALVPRPALYLATAEARDAEMADRIALHAVRRGPDWTAREVPLDLAAALATADRPVLVDCLTLWLANLLEAGRDPVREASALLAALPPHPVVMVTNEVGAGIVPDNALARGFRDAAGVLNQTVAARADRVILAVCGLPLIVKGTP